jgi:hypothetical protein
LPATQALGDVFLREAKFLIMRAPSAAVEGDFNILINPRHPLFTKVKLLKEEDFGFDVRLAQTSISVKD